MSNYPDQRSPARPRQATPTTTPPTSDGRPARHHAGLAAGRPRQATPTAAPTPDKRPARHHAGPTAVAPARRLRRRSSRGLGSDQGGVTLWAAIVLVALFVTIALVVDGNVMINARQRANSIAREAARSVGQQVVPAAPGGAVELDPVAARAAGLAYLDAAGCDNGTITIVGDTIEAVCPYPYQTVFLPGGHRTTGTGGATPLWVR